MREPPAGFVAQVKALCGADWEVRYNDHVGRWEFISTSAGGRRVSQFYGWYRNPLTGARIEPDPVTGLVPFRDLDIAAQQEILKSLEETYLGNRADGAKNWETWSGDRMRYNKQLDAQKRRQRAEDYAYALTQVDLRRPWVKYHSKQGKKLYA